MKILRAISIYFVLVFFASLSPAMAENTLTIVGLGPVPSFDPNQGTEWKLSSACVDINEAGQAACQTAADGPVYSCGWRNAQKCSTRVRLVHRWDGASLLNLSGADAIYDVPLAMNNNGTVVGYANRYVGERLTTFTGNGRIWDTAGSPSIKQSTVRWINDSGDYIQEASSSPGGVVNYTSQVHSADGAVHPLAGVFARPFVIGNKQHIIGAQILQSFVPDSQSSTGDEIAEVSGVGWILNQTQIDDLKRNEEGYLDDDGYLLYPVRFYRPMPAQHYATTVSDVNDFGEFVAKVQIGGYDGAFCDDKHSSEVRDYWGGKHTVPWKCKYTNIQGLSGEGKAYVGINNFGDAVGIFTPPPHFSSSPSDQQPRIWLKKSLNGWTEFDANDLLPVGANYTIVDVKDINTHRQVVGTCQHNTTEVRFGCILDLSDHPVPRALKKPMVSITSPAKGSTVSGSVTINANAFDRDGYIIKVIFKVGKKVIGVDKIPPYTATWDTEAYASGLHDIKAVAVDNKNNRRGSLSQLTVGTAAPPPPVSGVPVEGEGVITAVHSSSSIDIDEVITHIRGSTIIKFNDVSGFSVGLAIQYKGIMTVIGTIEASQLEVN